MEIRKHSRAGYVTGCRCEVCTNANKEYQRAYMREWRQQKKAVAKETSEQR